MVVNFSSLEQRIIFARSEMIPAFYPFENTSCSIEEQENLYLWISQVLKSIYQDPSLLYTNTYEDYAYPNPFTIVGSGHEEIMDIIRKKKKDLDTFILFLMDLGHQPLIGENELSFNGKMNKRYQNILSINGVSFSDNVLHFEGKPFLKALSWFSLLPGMTRVRFERLMFDSNHDYLSQMFIEPLNQEDGSVEMILDWLEEHNYEKVYSLDKYDKDESYMISFIKSISGKKEKLGFPYMGDNNHIGLSMEYRYTALHPYFLTIRIQGMKQILENLATLDNDIKEFIFENTKKCDGCKYCIQTDKTGNRPMARIAFSLEEKKYFLCPYYPGYSFSFRDITKKDAKDIISMMELVEKINL